MNNKVENSRRFKKMTENNAKRYIKSFGLDLLNIQEYVFGKSVAYAMTYGADQKQAKHIAFNAVASLSWIEWASKDEILNKMVADKDYLNRYKEFADSVVCDQYLYTELKKKQIEKHLEECRERLLVDAKILAKAASKAGHILSEEFYAKLDECLLKGSLVGATKGVGLANV